MMLLFQIAYGVIPGRVSRNEPEPIYNKPSGITSQAAQHKIQFSIARHPVHGLELLVPMLHADYLVCLQQQSRSLPQAYHHAKHRLYHLPSQKKGVTRRTACQLWGGTCAEARSKSPAACRRRWLESPGPARAAASSSGGACRPACEHLSTPILNDLAFSDFL